MAVGYHCISFASPLPSPPPPPPPPHHHHHERVPKTLAFTFPNRTNSGGCRSKSLFISSPNSRRHRSLILKVAESDRKNVNGNAEAQMEDNKGQNNGETKDLPPIKTLIQAYKKAIVDGDGKMASEVESVICIIENQKNELALKFSEVQAEITSGKEQFLRLKADFENFRKRSDSFRLTFTSDIQGDVLESLLPLVDSFDQARQQMKPETEKEKSIDTSYQGIYKQFVEIMRSLRVAVVETVGKPFDPSIHEAIAREQSQVFREGIVTQEVSRGFVLGERLLRPATVKVSTGPGPSKTPSDAAKSSETVAPAEDTASTVSSS